jgi:hypothetical protein
MLVFNHCATKDGDNKNKDNTETMTAGNGEGQEKGNEALGTFFFAFFKYYANVFFIVCATSTPPPR